MVVAFLFVLAIVSTPREAVWAFVGYLVVLVALATVARIPPGFVLRRMVVEVPFAIVALMLPVFGSGERVELLGVSLSEQGLWDMWNILAKATLGLFTAVILGATTQVPDLLKGLDALRVPRLVTSIISFMVRYIDVVMSDFVRMRVAMASRGHHPRWLRQWRPYAQTFGVMFVRTYERGERIYLAMVSRGYTGTMPRSLLIPAGAAQWAAAAGFVLAVWVIALSARALG